jgi:threonine dehydratase
MLPHIWIEKAAQRVVNYIEKTPLTFDRDENLYIKWENHQITGSFKARGALNKILSLKDRERQAGLVTASAGNHGQGVALAGRMVGAKVTVFVSEHAVPTKLTAMRKLGAQIEMVSGGYGEAELAGKRYAASNRATWISPYNDGQVIAGQATLGLEVLQEIPYQTQLTWVVPVGGGGLISGIGASIKSNSIEKPRSYPTQRMRLIGVQSQASPFMYSIFHSGTQKGVKEEPSLADGLSGPVEEGSLTIPLVLRNVDDLILVKETEIKFAVAYAWRQYGERIEGSAAAALVPALTGKIPNRPAVVIISGGNIEPEEHQRILQEHQTLR